MSLINDALKRASQNPPAPPAPPVTIPRIEMKPTTMPPVTEKPSRNFSWAVPVFVVLLIAGAVAIAGWMAMHRPTQTAAVAPKNAPAEMPVPTVAPAPATPAPVETPVAVAPSGSVAPPPTPPVETAPAPAKPVYNPDDAPRLQGIFYVPGKATAIIADKSVRVGDTIKQFRVQAISQSSVTLTDAEQRTIILTLGN